MTSGGAVLAFVYQVIALSCPLGTVLWVVYAALASHRRPRPVPGPSADELHWADLARLRAQIDDIQHGGSSLPVAGPGKRQRRA